MNFETSLFTSTYILRDALNASQNGIIITDNNKPDNPIIYCNTSFLTITGYSAEEIIGKNCRFLQGKETQQPEIAVIRTALREGIPCRVDIKNFRKNGEMFYNELYIAPVKNNLGAVTHFIGVQNDVTQRVAAQNNLQKEKKAADAAVAYKNKLITETRLYISNVIETLNEAIIILDDSLQIIEANKAFYAIFKTTIKETYGELIFNFGDGIFDIHPFRNLIERILPKYSSFNNYVIEHDFKKAGHKLLNINAKKIISQDYYKNRILLVIEDRTP